MGVTLAEIKEWINGGNLLMHKSGQNHPGKKEKRKIPFSKKFLY